MAKISTLLICLSLLCLLAGSSLANPAPMPFDDLELPELDKRQENNSTSTSSGTSSTSTRSTTSRTTSIVTPPTTTTTASRTTPTTPTTSSTPTTSTTPAPPVTTSTTSTSTSTTPRPPAETTSTDPAPSTTQSEDVVTASPTTRIVVATIYTTLSSNGQVSSYVTSSTTVETPTGTALPSGSDNSGGGSGLSSSTRNTIIGVVVGVGGALLIGGLAIVAWRLKRKRVNPVDEDDLMRRDGSPLAAGRDMHAASPETSPFKATLDQYHKPPGVVNTSSNF